MPPKTEVNFNAKNYFLTYPQCSLSKEELLTFLQSVDKVLRYAICEEKHEDGSPHLHALVEFSKKLHVTRARHFDVSGFHPQIQTCKIADISKRLEYVKKHGDFISTYEAVLGKRAALAQELIEEGALTKKFIRSHPEIIFYNYSSINSFLRLLQSGTSHYPSDKRRHIWVYGPSNCGKTYWLRAFRSLFENPVAIPPNNDYSMAGPGTDLLYSDEYKGCLTVQQLNLLCDGDTQLNTKGGSTFLNFPTVVICSNYPIRECYPKIDSVLYDSLVNRFQEYDLSINTPPFPKSIISL